MDKIKLAIIIISCIVALFTLLIGVKQPTMHKQAMFTDEYHEFVEEDIPTSNVSLSNTNIPTTNTIKNDNVTTQPQRKKIVKQIIRLHPQFSSILIHTTLFLHMQSLQDKNNTRR